MRKFVSLTALFVLLPLAVLLAPIVGTVVVEWQLIKSWFQTVRVVAKS